MVNNAINSAIEIVGSQQKLADACEVSQPTVWAWLHGRKKHPHRTLCALKRRPAGKSGRIKSDLI